MSPNNDLFIKDNKNIIKKLFNKLSIRTNRRYVYQIDIGLYDKNGALIFEGDVCKIIKDDINVVGVVSYVPQFASYCILDKDNYKYCTLGVDKCEYIEVVGNVFDCYD